MISRPIIQLAIAGSSDDFIYVKCRTGYEISKLWSSFLLSCFVHISNLGVIKMKVTNWYKNGDLDAFHKFCTGNRRKLISVHMRNGPEIVKGILHNHHFEPIGTAGVFILLTNLAVHPAFYALSDIDSLHYLASAALLQTSSVIPPALSIAPDGLICSRSQGCILM
jgi:hypothetical protein